MAITINWATRVISIPKADMTQLSATRYELNVDALRLALKDLEDSEEGMAFPSTHAHNTTVTVGGVTLARVVEIVNGYTITFEAGTYSVSLVGANNNIADVMNLNAVSLRSNNSAGLIVVTDGAGGDPWVTQLPGAYAAGSAGAKLGNLPSAAQIAAAVWDYSDGVELAITPIQAQRLILAAAAGKISGAETTTVVLRAAAMSGTGKVRITATTDENGNRTALVLDVSP